MTGLGAAIYGGFFVLAALWLFVTSDAGMSNGRGSGPAARPLEINQGRGRCGVVQP